VKVFLQKLRESPKRDPSSKKNGNPPPEETIVRLGEERGVVKGGTSV